MKNLGSLIKKYGVKQIINLAYIVPVILLIVGIVMIAISMFKALETDRNYYLIAMVILLVLILILLIARASNLPKYGFELYENGIKVIYKKDKTPNEEYSFDEIGELWHVSTSGGVKGTNMVFRSNTEDYKLISSKIADYKGLIAKLSTAVVAQQLPEKSQALTQGGRLSFAMLPPGGEQVLISEKAILPYFKQAKKEHFSLDRFSLFDGQKTYALADISKVIMEKSSGNILIQSIAGNTLYTQNYFGVCNVDLFLAIMEELVVNSHTQPSGEMS